LAKGLTFLGLTPHTVQRVFLTTLFAGLALAMFFFLRTLLPEREQLAASFVGALFYAFNPSLFMVIPNAVILTGLVLLPLLPALILRGSRAIGWRYPLLLALASVPLSYAFGNPPVFALVVAAALTALVVSLLTRPRLAVGGFVFRSAFLVVPAALWWVLPVAFSLASSQARITPDVDPIAWAWTHARGSLKNVLLLTPTWGWPRPEYFPLGSRSLRS
jgi:hypothetical protein